ncbi:MAG: hypothetical protein ABEJ31_13565 [Haloarculaceae archaeon]
MASPLRYQPRLLYHYLRGGEEGVHRAAKSVHELAHGQPGSKLSKKQALYTPQSPLPALIWRHECERCHFWREGEPDEPGTCHVVGQPDDPYGGEAIHPRGVCAYFTPPPGEPAFGWYRERFHPTGAETVRGEYRKSLAESGAESESPERKREIPVTEAGRDGGD